MKGYHSNVAIDDFISGLKYQTANDLAEVDLLIAVPWDEPTGPKNSTLTFIAEQA